MSFGIPFHEWRGNDVLGTEEETVSLIATYAYMILVVSDFMNSVNIICFASEFW